MHAADLARLAEIEAWATQHTPANFLDGPRAAEDWAARFEASHEQYPWLVVEEEGRVLGYGIAFRYRPRPAYRWCVEVAVYVDHEHHRRGIATRLYRALFDLLERQGLRTVLAIVVSPNEPSERLHERVGMRLTGSIADAGFKHGRWWATSVYELQIGNGDAGEVLPVAAVWDQADPG